MVAPHADLPVRVEGLLEGALGWLDEHRWFFDPFREGELVGLREIPLSELAILTLSMLRSRHSCPPAVTARFLDVLEAAHREPVFRERPFREVESLVSHLLVSLALEAGGRGVDPVERERFGQLVRSSNLRAAALPPHRTMELRHALDLAGLDAAMPSYRRLYRRTMVASPLNPVFLSRPETYIVTHVLFYVSDLGFRPPRGLGSHEVRRLSGLVDQLLAMSLIARNWDLVAEFILSATCLGRDSRFSPTAWESLARAQWSDGSVPGLRAPRDEQEPADLHQRVAGSYHTTLVSCLAALATLHRHEGG